MKRVYLWNDLPLFREMHVLPFEHWLGLSIANLQVRTQSCHIEYISYNEWTTWTCSLPLNGNGWLRIGTRPNAIEQHSDGLAIYPVRRRYRNISGSLLSPSETLGIIKYAQQNAHHLNVLEDVLVSGDTMCELVELFRDIRRIDCHVFIGQGSSVERLRRQFRNLHFHLGREINGDSLEETTVFCLYDLLYEYFKPGVRYCDSVECLSRFFEGQTLDFQRWIDNVRNRVSQLPERQVTKGNVNGQQ